MLQIRDFVRPAGVSTTTLRYYDEIGLLKPIHVDPETGYWFYTMDQLPHLHCIRTFKEPGLAPTQIAVLLSEPEPMAPLFPESLASSLWSKRQLRR